MVTPQINAHAGIQVALTVLALAALPITAWLYIADHVETRVDAAVARHDRSVQISLSRQTEDIDNLQVYVRQLCAAARRNDSSFSCERERYRYQPYR